MKKSNALLTKIRKTHKLSLLWILTVLMFASCSGLSSTSKETVEAGADPSGSALRLASELYQRGASLQTLAARGGASYTLDGKRSHFKFEAVMAKPGRMLFTALDPMGRPAFRLVSDGQTLTGLLYSAKQYATGPATAANFGRFIPLGLSPDQLIVLMTGSVPQPAKASARSTGGSTELTVLPVGMPEGTANQWRIKVEGPLDQNPATAKVTSAILGQANNPKMSIKYLSIKDVAREDLNGQMEPFPSSVEVEWNDVKKQSLRVTYEEVRLGLPLGDELFTLTQPEGFEFIQLP